MSESVDGARGAYPIRAVGRVCDVLDALRAAPEGLTLTALAEQIGLPKSSALRYLSALEARNYVQRSEPHNAYRLGNAFRPSTSQYQQALREEAMPHLIRLRDRFGETLSLGLLEGHSMLALEVIETLHQVRPATRRGSRLSIHSTALGKAAATLISERRIRDLLTQAGLPSLTDRTITSADQFVASVHRCALDGFALDDRENELQHRSVAVALPGLPIPAAVAVHAPCSRWSLDRTITAGRDLMTQIAPLIDAASTITR